MNFKGVYSILIYGISSENFIMFKHWLSNIHFIHMALHLYKLAKRYDLQLKSFIGFIKFMEFMCAYTVFYM